MKRARQRVDINIEELDTLLDRTREGPLSDTDREKLRTALHVLAQRVRPPRTTEKTRAVIARRAGFSESVDETSGTAS